MNVLFFLRPKVSTAYIYYDNTLRQGLEKLRHYGYTRHTRYRQGRQIQGNRYRGRLFMEADRRIRMG